MLWYLLYPETVILDRFQSYLRSVLGAHRQCKAQEDGGGEDVLPGHAEDGRAKGKPGRRLQFLFPPIPDFNISFSLAAISGSFINCSFIPSILLICSNALSRSFALSSAPRVSL